VTVQLSCIEAPYREGRSPATDPTMPNAAAATRQMDGTIGIGLRDGGLVNGYPWTRSRVAREGTKGSAERKRMRDLLV
jgi:hypothetical protein